MATYISTFKFTEKGVQGIRNTTKRAAAFKAAAKKMGVKTTGVYWLLGRYDGLLIFEAPDDKTATAAMLYVASQGNVKTSTSRAFDAAEMEKVIAALPK